MFILWKTKATQRREQKYELILLKSISLLTRERQLTLSTPKAMIASNPASNYAKVRPRYSLMAQPNLLSLKGEFQATLESNKRYTV